VARRASRSVQLATAADHVKNFKNLAKTSDEQSKLLTETCRKGGIEIQRLQNQLDGAKKLAETKAEALDGIGNDLTQQRQKQEAAEKSLQETIKTLTEQKDEAVRIGDSSSSRMEEFKKDVDVYIQEAKSSQEKFEREVENHAEARKGLREAREKLDAEGNGKIIAETKLIALETESKGKESLWNEERAKFNDSIKSAEEALTSKEGECALLHSQYVASEVSEQIEITFFCFPTHKACCYRCFIANPIYHQQVPAARDCEREEGRRKRRHGRWR